MWYRDLSVTRRSSYQRRAPLRPDADHLDRRADQLLDALDVLLGLGRELFEAAAAGEVATPAGDRLIHRLDLGQHVDVGAEVGQASAMILIAGADLDAIESAEHVQQHERRCGDAAEIDAVFQCNNIQPTASSRASRGRAVLVATL